MVPRRPLRPVEPRRVGDGARRRRPAPPRPRRRTSGWPTRSDPTAAGTTTTGPTAPSRRTSSTPTCAPTSPPACGTTGAARGTAPSSTTCGRPSSGRSTACCRCAGADGLVLWAVEADGTRTWDYALLTGTSSIHHALRCGVALADDRRRAAPGVGAGGRRRWSTPIADRPDAFEPKVRWAMDWYYPVLTGALTGEAAKARLAEGWDAFAMEGRGIRCVSDEPWVTASETAECALAYAAIGDRATADGPAGVDAGRTAATTARTGPASSTADGRRADPLPVRGAHVVHRGRRDPRRRRHRRRLPRRGPLHPPPRLAGLT